MAKKSKILDRHLPYNWITLKALEKKIPSNGFDAMAKFLKLDRSATPLKLQVKSCPTWGIKGISPGDLERKTGEPFMGEVPGIVNRVVIAMENVGFSDQEIILQILKKLPAHFAVRVENQKSHEYDSMERTFEEETEQLRRERCTAALQAMRRMLDNGVAFQPKVLKILTLVLQGEELRDHKPDPDVKTMFENLNRAMWGYY
jgi:hypothetical protein